MRSTVLRRGVVLALLAGACSSQADWLPGTWIATDAQGEPLLQVKTACPGAAPVMELTGATLTLNGDGETTFDLSEPVLKCTGTLAQQGAESLIAASSCSDAEGLNGSFTLNADPFLMAIGANLQREVEGNGVLCTVTFTGPFYFQSGAPPTGATGGGLTAEADAGLNDSGAGGVDGGAS